MSMRICVAQLPSVREGVMPSQPYSLNLRWISVTVSYTRDKSTRRKTPIKKSDSFHELNINEETRFIDIQAGITYISMHRYTHDLRLERRLHLAILYLLPIDTPEERVTAYVFLAPQSTTQSLDRILCKKLVDAQTE